MAETTASGGPDLPRGLVAAGIGTAGLPATEGGAGSRPWSGPDHAPGRRGPVTAAKLASDADRVREFYDSLAGRTMAPPSAPAPHGGQPGLLFGWPALGPEIVAQQDEARGRTDLSP